jgi:O-glycosyl hydrolase
MQLSFGSFSRFVQLIVLMAFFSEFSVFSQRTIEINIEEHHQLIHGFGASDAWNTNYVGRYWSLAVRNDIARKLFSQNYNASGSPEGIGLSRWRFNVGAGSAEQGTESNIDMEERRVECFLNEDGTYNWNKQIGQQWFLQQARNYGVEHLVAFLNSPPRFYTKNGRTNSNNTNRWGPTNLKDDHYQQFADFMVAVLKYFDEQDLSFSQISPVNEPQYEWNSGQEGCPWNNADVKLLATHLNDAIVREGLDTKILLSEAASYDYMHQVSGDPNKSDLIWKFFNPSRPEYLGNLSQLMPGLAGHSYFTDSSDERIREARANILRESREQGGIELYQTEYNLLSRHFSDKYTNTLFLAKMIHADLTIANMSIWDYWTAMERERWSQLNRFYLVRLRPSGGDYGSLTAGGSVIYDKNLWALGNYSFFIRPGYRRVTMTGADELSGLMSSAYLAPDSSRLVMVYVNWGESAEQVHHQFIGLPEGKHIRTIKPYITNAANNLSLKADFKPEETYTVAARSIVTLVAELETVQTAIELVNTDQFVIMFDQAGRTIRVVGHVANTAPYSITDMQGKQLAQGVLANKESQTIDVQYLETGWYVFHTPGLTERFMITNSRSW